MKYGTPMTSGRTPARAKRDAAKRRAEEKAWRAKNGPLTIREADGTVTVTGTEPVAVERAKPAPVPCIGCGKVLYVDKPYCSACSRRIYEAKDGKPRLRRR
jgi:hypothetical protein